MNELQTTAPSDNDSVLSPKDEAVRCAETFLITYIDSFNELKASGNIAFPIPTGEWDQFLVENGFTSYTAIPEHGTPDWAMFRGQSNTTRYAMNRVARIGMHGEPAFTVSNNKRGMLEVGTTQHIIDINYNETMGAVRSLVDNKKRDSKRMTEHFQDHWQELPVHIQAQLSMCDMMMRSTVERLTNELNTYRRDYQEVQEKAASYINPRLEHGHE